LPEPCSGPVLFDGLDADDLFGAFESGAGDGVIFSVIDDGVCGDGAIGESVAEPSCGELSGEVERAGGFMRSGVEDVGRDFGVPGDCVGDGEGEGVGERCAVEF